MTGFGRSLRIYLADGSPSGVRLAEIVNWTGQAIACPRTRIAELVEWAEVARPGVYLLLEGGLGTDRGRVYMGESENVRDRLASHLLEKEFWTEAVAFTSKDTNLTKAHVRYLEARLIHLAKLAGRYDVDNSNAGFSAALPRADADAMEEFLANLRMVLGALGHRLLEPLVIAPVVPAPVTATTVPAPSGILGTLLRFDFLGLSAVGYATDEGFTVLKKSQVAIDAQPSTPKHVIALRQAALASGSMVKKGEHFSINEDMAFTSSSTAACFVAGSSRSGPLSWHTDTGVTLKELEQQSAAGIAPAI
ncbi:protein of unknown function DUF4357 [Gemmatirosa kalamazoonensis]|uniref:GIY-YIG domain-containing protein n=1 Tax=Gemmatirosa kalamazoonensis TaxID=861299 RepID=W0RL96_9BACT|nr:GIY-YIG nuclease family protein [Gemmatirosa kalamazoonensis]AHG91854.1 protein of unknown function DUF4357 [Gemmatirosa kalamazoonensis]